MPLFGTEPTTVRVARYGYTRRYGTVRADFFNVFEDPDARPTVTRIAFAAPSTDVVVRSPESYARTADKTWTVPPTSPSTIRRSMRSSLKIRWETT
jgi:hypothetical protein